MSSGDVVFILAFIVLPTAILVSSVWAVVFVRRRPDRIARDANEQQPVMAVEPSSSTTDTRVLTTIETPSGTPAVVAEQSEAEQAQIQTDPKPVLADEDKREPEVRPLETALVQTTEDLDDVVAAVSAIEEQQPASASDPVPSPNPEPGADERHSAPEPEEEHFETSELPVVEERHAVPDPEPQEELPSRQRRKQSVKLLPGDPDIPRQRGRNRDVPRQVPQLNRAFRRKDEAPADPPPDPEAETGAATSRD